MISREHILDEVHYASCHPHNKRDELLTQCIDKIYDSIGSCGECIYLNGCRTHLTITDTENRNSLDFFCADFERKDNDVLED